MPDDPPPIPAWRNALVYALTTIALAGAVYRGVYLFWLRTAADEAHWREMGERVEADKKAREAEFWKGGENPFAGNRDKWDKERAEARPVLDRFLNMLREGSFADAYSFTGGGYRDKQTREEFVAEVEKFPTLRHPELPGKTTSSVDVSNGVTSHTFAVAFVGPAGPQRWFVSLTKVGERWVVNGFRPAK